MKERYIPAVIVLFAGSVTGIICIIQKFDTLFSLKLLLGILVGFYIIGLIAKAVIVKVIGESKAQIETEEAADEKNMEEGTDGQSVPSEEKQPEEEN